MSCINTIYQSTRAFQENRRIIFGREYLDYFIEPNGTKIELGFFLDDRMKEVSAVIFSNLATWGKVRALSADPNPNVLFESKRFNEPGLKAHRRLQRKRDYKESLLDGLHIFANPNADIPLSPSMLNWPDAVYHTLDISTDELCIPLDTIPDGQPFGGLCLPWIRTPTSTNRSKKPTSGWKRTRR
jgi:hypothetical protein